MKIMAQRTLPIGVHVHPHGVAVASMRTDQNGAPGVDKAGYKPCAAGAEAQALALRTLCEELDIANASAVLSMRPDTCAVKRFEVPRPMRKTLIRQAAEMEADSIDGYAGAERIVDVADLPNTSDKMIAVARRREIDALTGVAKAAKLTPVGIDVPLATWQRTMFDKADALLEIIGGVAALYVFGVPIGEQYLLGTNLTTERIVNAVRARFVDHRRLKENDLERLVVCGDYSEMTDLLRALAIAESVTKMDMLTVATAEGHAENPPWGYAAMLATWGLP